MMTLTNGRGGYGFLSSSENTAGDSGGPRLNRALDPNFSGDPEELALDYLEQWLSAPNATAAVTPVETPRSLDPSLRAIERLVSQHRDLFRRHSQNQ
jgi:hypothetical protein